MFSPFQAYCSLVSDLSTIPCFLFSGFWCFRLSRFSMLCFWCFRLSRVSVLLFLMFSPIQALFPLFLIEPFVMLFLVLSSLQDVFTVLHVATFKGPLFQSLRYCCIFSRSSVRLLLMLLPLQTVFSVAPHVAVFFRRCDLSAILLPKCRLFYVTSALCLLKLPC